MSQIVVWYLRIPQYEMANKVVHVMATVVGKIEGEKNRAVNETPR